MMEGGEAARIAIRIIISGKVQGVWFRNWTIREAGVPGLDGWVCNRPDGTVEALFSGPQAAVRAMIAACHTGPPAAEVAAIVEHDADPLPPNSGFAQKAG